MLLNKRTNLDYPFALRDFSIKVPRVGRVTSNDSPLCFDYVGTVRCAKVVNRI